MLASKEAYHDDSRHAVGARGLVRPPPRALPLRPRRRSAAAAAAHRQAGHGVAALQQRERGQVGGQAAGGVGDEGGEARGEVGQQQRRMGVARRARERGRADVDGWQRALDGAGEVRGADEGLFG